MTDDGSFPMTRRTALGVSGAALGSLALGGASVTGQQRRANTRRYRITVTNLAEGQFLTPPAAAIHTSDVEVFAVGDPANEPTQQIAENGNLGPLLDLIEESDEIVSAAVGDMDLDQPAPLVPKDDPGGTGFSYYATLELTAPKLPEVPFQRADEKTYYLSFISMLIATNDGFTGLDTVPLPSEVNESRSYYALGYDAGTEENTERFEDLVPPAQGLSGRGIDGVSGTGQSDPDLATDDVIAPHEGITGRGDLDPAFFDWDDPVAAIQIERLG
jgi:hypothetical protein